MNTEIININLVIKLTFAGPIVFVQGLNIGETVYTLGLFRAYYPSNNRLGHYFGFRFRSLLYKNESEPNSRNDSTISSHFVDGHIRAL